MNHETRRLSELPGPVTTTRTVVSAASASAEVLPSSHLAPASALGLLRALQRRLALALGVGILAAAVFGTAAWFLVPPAKYKAEATLIVVSRPPQILFRTVETQDLDGGEEYHRYQRTQIGLVKSRLVLNAALQQQGVSKFRMVKKQGDPVKWLQDKLDVNFESNSELLKIGLSGQDPEELAALVNAVKDAYMEEVVNVEHKRRVLRLDTLQMLKKKYAEIIKSQRDTLRKLAETVGSDDRQTLALKQQFAMEHLASVERELLEVQSRKRSAEAELKLQRQLDALRETSTPAVSEAEVDRMIEQDPIIMDLRHRLSNAEISLNAGNAHAHRIARDPVNGPALKHMQDKVEVLRKSLASQRAALRPVVIRRFQNLGTNTQQSRSDELQQQLAVLEELEQRLNNEVQKLDKGGHALTVNTLDLQGIQDEIAQIRNAATRVGSEVEALNVELQAPPRIRALEPAVVPRTRDDKKRYMMIGLTTFASFFAGLFGIGFLELRSRKVDSAGVVVGLGLPLVGSLPIVPVKVRDSGGVARSEKARHRQNLLESIDATRTMLVHAARSGSYRVVMITSALGGEGKTSLATHLAISLARSGWRTLLIDGDLRKPSIDRLFDVPPGPGLGELLRGEVPLDGVIAPAPNGEPKLITAGKCDEQTIWTLAKGGLGTIFGQLKEQFDFVIVDSSPILPVADALTIAQQADAVLFSILRDVSRTTKVFAAYQLLSRLGVPVLGAVVTGMAGDECGNDYYSGSSYLPRSQTVVASSDPSS